MKAIEHAGEAAFNEAMTAVIAQFNQPDGSVRIAARFRYLVAAP